MQRRALLQWLVGGGSVVVLSAVAAPALLSALSPAAVSRTPRWRRVGLLSDYREGEVAKATVAIDPEQNSPGRLNQVAVYVWRKSAADIVVFSTSCTDLGCPVTHDPGSGFFYCPCHGGVFNQAGDPVAGPPDRPLYQYANRIQDGILEIDLSSVPLVA